jgi:hypothetical protein
MRFDEPGPRTVLQCLDVPVPEPKSGEVLIRARRDFFRPDQRNCGMVQCRSVGGALTRVNQRRPMPASGHVASHPGIDAQA